MVYHPTWKRFIDKVIYVFIFGAILMTVPQIMKIWVEKNASGVSILSWGAYLVSALFWLLYGFAHKDKPVIISSALWVLFDTLIIIGVALYG